MKKLWTRFKHWLIKKLGGYVEGPQTIKVHRLEPITVNQTLLGVRRVDYHSDPDYQKYVDRTLANKLAEYIVERQQYLITISETVNFDRDDTITLHADMRLLPKP